MKATAKWPTALILFLAGALAVAIYVLVIANRPSPSENLLPPAKPRSLSLPANPFLRPYTELELYPKGIYFGNSFEIVTKQLESQKVAFRSRSGADWQRIYIETRAAPPGRQDKTLMRIEMNFGKGGLRQWQNFLPEASNEMMVGWYRFWVSRAETVLGTPAFRGSPDAPATVTIWKDTSGTELAIGLHALGPRYITITATAREGTRP